MSPIFRRKKHAKSAESVDRSQQVSGAESGAATDALASAEAENATTGSRSGGQGGDRRADSGRAGESSGADRRSRDELVSRAYERWHDELAERAASAETDDPKAANAGRIDLTHTHPTGAASFSGHSVTRLTSLVREPVAQQTAKARLAQLHDIVDAMSEEHGHAPVSLAVGKLTWTELPEPREGELAAEAWDVTGELRLDPGELEARGVIPTRPDAPESDEEGESDGTGSEEPKSKEQGESATDVVPEPDVETEPEPGETEPGETKPGETEPGEADEPPADEIRDARVVTEPAVYRSVRIEFLADGDALLQLSKKAEVNPVVLRALRDNGATPETISQVRELVASPDTIDEGLARLQGLGRVYLPGFAYDHHEELGCFTRPEQTMLSDLEAMEPYIRTSGIMAGLAGDPATKELAKSPIPPGDAEDRAPEAERGAGDHDVEELHAVEAVASGRSIVLDCPPGSERFSTIAAIAADVAASGGSVLMVPSRASSGQNLKNELDQLGLGDLVLDFTDLETVPRRIRTGMRLERPELPVEETLANRESLVAVREALSTFVADLHKHDNDWDMSIYELLETLADLTSSDDGPTTKVRLGDDAVGRLREGGIESVKGKFARAGELGAFDPAVAASAWARSPITSNEEGAKALEEARRLSDVSLRAVISQSSRAAGETGLTQARSLKEWFEQVDVLDGIAESLDTFTPEIFEMSAMNMVIATGPKDWRERHGHTMKLGDRRRYTKQAKDLLRPGVNPDDLHGELKAAQSRRDIWRRYSTEGGWPRLPDGMSQIRVMKNEVSRDIESLSRHLGGEDFVSLSFDKLQKRLASLVDDGDHMASLPERNSIVVDLRETGFGPLLDDLVARGVTAEQAQGEVELAYSSSIFERLIAKSPTLARLAPSDVSSLLAQLRDLDKKHVDSLAGPVLLAVVNHGRRVMQTNRADTLRLDELLANQGLGGLRDLIATYSSIVQAARPVWIAAPTVVAEFVPPMPWADLVIVETTDQSSVASLVSPMMRGRQVLVVGDTRRIAVGRETSAINEIAEVLPVLELPTHRAAHDELSARALLDQGYGDVLTPVPSARRMSTSRLIQVDGKGVPTTGGDGAIESTRAEVDAVVDALLEHATARSDESLAIIAISPLHAQRIRDAVRDLRAQSSDVAELSSPARQEPLVIVDITQAASIRRDHVILSVGFGKTVHGRVLHSFGVLATPAGLVGLIDAIEAPRRELTIISALGPGEIDTNNLSTPGPHLLADLLEQAAGSGQAPQSSASAQDDSEVTPLLADLVERVEAAGWVTTPNYGFPGSVRIPLVAGHGDIPGTWAVAVLLDDEEYIEEKSLRRRDRYGTEVLEARGWKVHQTYSSSLFIDPEGEAQRVIALLTEARAEANPRAVEVPTLAEQGDDGWGQVVVDESTDPHAASQVMPAVQDRGPRPPITLGLALAAYSDDQLDEMAQWVARDGIPRNQLQFVEDLRNELGIRRRGGQTDAVLGNVVRRSGLVDPDAPDVSHVASEEESAIMEEEEEVLRAHQEAHSEPDAEDPSPVPADHSEEQEVPGVEDDRKASESDATNPGETEIEGGEGSDVSEAGDLGSDTPESDESVSDSPAAPAVDESVSDSPAAPATPTVPAAPEAPAAPETSASTEAVSNGVEVDDEAPSFGDDPILEDPYGDDSLGERR